MNYIVLIYDEKNELAAALENATKPTYNRAKNSADQVEMSVPRSDPKVSEVQIGRRFEVYRGGTDQQVREVSGYVSERGYEGDEFIINGYTEEIKLSRYLTPAQFGYPLYIENETLDKFVTNLNRPYLIDRVKYNWGDYASSEFRVNYEDEGNEGAWDYVALQGRQVTSEGPFYERGWIVFRFEKEDDEKWERIRWVSDYGDDVRTTIQYGHSNLRRTNISDNYYSNEISGALTDTQGFFEAIDRDQKYLYVRVNFETDDEQETPRLFALEVIKRGPYIFDAIHYPNGASDIKTPNLEADSKNFLDVLIDALDESEWEFKVENNELHIAETMGSDRSNDFTLVES